MTILAMDYLHFSKKNQVTFPSPVEGRGASSTRKYDNLGLCNNGGRAYISTCSQNWYVWQREGEREGESVYMALYATTSLVLVSKSWEFSDAQLIVEFSTEQHPIMYTYNLISYMCFSIFTASAKMIPESLRSFTRQYHCSRNQIHLFISYKQKKKQRKAVYREN